MEGQQPLRALINYREREGMTPAELARFLEQPRPTVHRWETGARKISRLKLDDVAKKTGIPKRELRPDLAELLTEEAAQ